MGFCKCESGTKLNAAHQAPVTQYKVHLSCSVIVDIILLL